MLTHLKIQNYALIRDLEVDLDAGLSIITGETGAGKSILLGALGLILGDRADSSALKDQDSRCIVEGHFLLDGLDLESLFEQHDLDYERLTIFRREILPAGKSRAFINDTPVMLKVMQEIGFRLIDIHSQHENLDLQSRAFQLMVVDLCAGNQSLLNEYSTEYKTYRQAVAELQEAKLAIEKARGELEYDQYQWEQLDKAALSEGEQERLEQELEMLTHAEEIKSGLSQATELLNGDHQSVVDQVKMVLGQFNRLTTFLPDGPEMVQRIESVYLELKDLATASQRIAERVEFDPSRVEKVNDRLDLLYTLQQRHHVSSVEGLIAIRDRLAERIATVVSGEEWLEQLMHKRDKQQQLVESLASQLADRRRRVIPQIEDQVVRQLFLLGMPNARFQVEITQLAELSLHGNDLVNLLFTANKNGSLNDLSKVASGGELSRVMLAVKALISKSKALPTIIFDEIDTGISGEIADRMGTILKEIAADMQVINITHLPQIAAKGDHHFRVYKEDSAHESITRLTRLTPAERVEEVAKMLSGEMITAAAIRNAEELLK